MNLRAFLLLLLLLVAVVPLAVVASVVDTKHDVGNQVGAHDAKYELDQGVQGGGGDGLDVDESKHGGGLGRTLQRGGGDTERGRGGGDSSRGGGRGDRSRGGGDRERRRGRRGGRGGGG